MPVSSLEERRRTPAEQNSFATAVQRRPPRVGLGVGVLGLVDVEVALPELVAHPGELRRRLRERLGVQHVVEHDVREGLRRRGSARPCVGRSAVEAVEVDEAGGHGAHDVTTTPAAGSPVRLAARLLTSQPGPSAERHPQHDAPSCRPARAATRRASASSSSPTTPPRRSPQTLDAAARSRSSRPSTTCWSATTRAPTTPTRSGLRFQSGSQPAADRGAARAEPRLRRQPEGRLRTGRSSTASTSSCCSTATASTRPSASRTSSPRWCAARPTPSSARG